MLKIQGIEGYNIWRLPNLGKVALEVFIELSPPTPSVFTIQEPAEKKIMPNMFYRITINVASPIFIDIASSVFFIAA